MDDGEPITGLEIKTADATKMSEWGQEDSDEIPVEYLIQCQWYCGLLGLPDWHIAVGFVKPGSRKICGYREYRIEHNVDRYESMKQRAIEFWENHVVPKVSPEITEPDAATILYYKTKYRIPEKEIFSNDALEAQIEAVVFRQSNLKEAERFFELEKTRLIAELGIGDELLAKYKRTTQARRFTIGKQ